MWLHDFNNVSFKLVLWINILVTCEIVLRECHKTLLIHDKSTQVQVMALCHQAKSHYLVQCWPRSMLQYGVSSPQWVNYVLYVNYECGRDMGFIWLKSDLWSTFIISVLCAISHLIGPHYNEIWLYHGIAKDSSAMHTWGYYIFWGLLLFVILTFTWEASEWLVWHL